jgi:Tfp pilus assembly protein PilX
MRFLRRFKAQEGVTLIMAIGILGVLSLTGATLIYYSSSNARSASSSKANETAYTLAEAGVAQALSVLNNALNPLTGSLLQSTTLQLEGGSVTYAGTLNGTTWTITSTGTVTNPTGASAVKRTLTRNAEVYGLNSGANVAAWNRWYSDQTSCLTVQDVTIQMPFATRGGLCMVGSAQITGSGTTVEVGGNVTMVGSGTSGARNPSAATGWTSSTNVYTSNNVYATATINGSSQSANLDVTGFGFSIPAGATINGIDVDIERKASATSSIEDFDVYVLKNGSATGITDHASTTDWTTSDSTRSYGNSSDLWGTTWTVSDINASNFGVRLKATNLTGTSKTASVDWVQVTVFYTPLPATTIGTSGTPLASVQVTGTCKYAAQTAHTPCGSADKVWGNTIGTAPQNLSMPAIDMAYWYTNGKPGPLNNCTTGSFPGGFDNDTTYNASRSGSAEVTPTSSSYTCQVKDSLGNILGEISWNHVTHVLKIKGTIFIDGDFRFDDDGQVVHYQGRGIIYAAGHIEFDELVCAGGSGTTSCVDTGMANWDPSQNMMVVLAGATGALAAEYDQGSTQSQSVPSGLQGLIYARGECVVHENFHTSGPIVCGSLSLPSSSNGWPTYYDWPPLGSLVEGQMYTNPSTAGDFVVVPGMQSG